jgi:hypothetical protein
MGAVRNGSCHPEDVRCFCHYGQALLTVTVSPMPVSNRHR